MYFVRYEPKVPDEFKETIKRYVEHGIRPGGFTTALLENDLLGVSQPFISAIESGVKPSLSLVKKIEDITGEDCSHIVAEIKAYKEFIKKVKRLDYEKRKAVENLIDRI